MSRIEPTPIVSSVCSSRLRGIGRHMCISARAACTNARRVGTSVRGCRRPIVRSQPLCNVEDFGEATLQGAKRPRGRNSLSFDNQGIAGVPRLGTPIAHAVHVGSQRAGHRGSAVRSQTLDEVVAQNIVCHLASFSRRESETTHDEAASGTAGDVVNITGNAMAIFQPAKLIAEEAIRNCAYQKWEAAGKPTGDGVQFWLAAEKELSRSRTRGWWTHIPPWIVPRRLRFFRRGNLQRS